MSVRGRRDGDADRPGISGKAAGLKLKAGAKNTITMKIVEGRQREGDVQDRPQDERAPDDGDTQRDGEAR